MIKIYNNSSYCMDGPENNFKLFDIFLLILKLLHPNLKTKFSQENSINLKKKQQNWFGYCGRRQDQQYHIWSDLILCCLLVISNQHLQVAHWLVILRAQFFHFMAYNNILPLLSVNVYKVHRNVHVKELQSWSNPPSLAAFAMATS